MKTAPAFAAPAFAAPVFAPTLALILCLGLSACATSGPGPALSDSEAAGRALAVERCGGCHAVALRGASPMALAPPLRDLHRRYDVEGLAEALAEGISVGNPVMPEHVLQADEIAALIAYLRTLER